MTRQSGLNGETSSFRVTNLTDHHDIGVLTENGAKTGSESETGIGIDLNLINTIHLVLNWVFHGDNIDFFGFDFLDEGIKSGGLTGTGRTGSQNHAVWFPNAI